MKVESLGVRTLRGRILFGSIALICLYSVVIITFVVLYETEQVRQSRGTQLQRIVTMEQRLITQFFEDRQQEGEFLARQVEGIYDKPDEIRYLLQSFLLGHSQFVALYYGVPGKGIITASPGVVPNPQEWEKRWYVREALQGNDAFDDAGMGRFVSGDSHLILAKPIRNGQGNVVAVLWAEIQDDTIIGMMNMGMVGESGETVLLNRNGVRLTDTRFPELSNRETDESDFSQGFEFMLERAHGGETGIVFYNDYQNKPVMGTSRWLPGQQWLIVGQIRMDEIMRPLYRQAVLMILGALFLQCTIYVLTSRYIMDRIQKPVVRLMKGARMIAAGRYDYTIDANEMAADAEEFVQLCEAFNQMGRQVWEQQLEMEYRVMERTAELVDVNAVLRREVVEREQAEKEAVSARQQVVEILESVSDGFYALDRRFSVTYVNRAAEQSGVLARNEMIGKNLLEAFPIFSEPLFYEAHTKALEEQIPVYVEGVQPETQQWMEVHIYPRGGSLSVFFRDVTDRKRLEIEMARLSRLNLVGEMAAGIGHEVRNPMTTVRGFLQLLRGKENCQAYHEYFEIMIEELDRANAIITEFLSLAKNKTIQLEKTDLNVIVGALAPLIEADGLMADKYLKLEMGSIPEVEIDGKEIRQLILNLARNGMEAMTPGGYLTIRTYVDGDGVVLAVADQGSGIPREILEKLGTPFFTTKEQGTGLGLALCYSIAARHKANIWVDSGTGGTTFYVRFQQLMAS